MIEKTLTLFCRSKGKIIFYNLYNTRFDCKKVLLGRIFGITKLYVVSNRKCNYKGY